MNNRFLKFVITGGLAAVVNFSSRFFYSQFYSFVIAVILAYITGMITAFILNRLFVFQDSKQSVLQQIFYFTLVNLLAVVQTVVISVGLAEYIFPLLNWDWYRESLAHGIGIIVPIFTSFWGHKKYSFGVEVAKKVPLPFEETPFNFSGKTVLLDIDGTLVPDNTIDIDSSVQSAINKLAEENTIWLCTNSKNVSRNEMISQKIGIPLLLSNYKKPNVKLLQQLPADQSKDIVVIGDKFLTDELLAWFSKCRFIRVFRKLSGRERIKIKMINILDDSLYTIIRFFQS